MKLRLTCAVESEVILQRRVELYIGKDQYWFEIDSNGFWNSLTVYATITDPSTVQWGTVPATEPRAPNQAPFNVVGKFGDETYENVIKDIQSLESALSLYMPLRSINWRYPVMEVIFEEGDKRTHGHLGAVSVRPKKPGPSKIEEKAFLIMAGIGLKAQSSTVVASFWREGENDWREGKYINAFFNYYFVLEGLHGNGKTKNYQVEEAMTGSPTLRAHIEKFLNTEHLTQHLTQLTEMMNATLLPNVEDLVKLLISTRGKLHHFQNNPNREQGSPLTHERYQAVAYLARGLAHASIMTLHAQVKGIAFAPKKPTSDSKPT